MSDFRFLISKALGSSCQSGMVCAINFYSEVIQSWQKRSLSLLNLGEAHATKR